MKINKELNTKILVDIFWKIILGAVGFYHNCFAWVILKGLSLEKKK